MHIQRQTAFVCMDGFSGQMGTTTVSHDTQHKRLSNTSRRLYGKAILPVSCNTRQNRHVIQAVWKGHQARLLVQTMRAALVLQKVWRGRAVRLQLQQQQRAALHLQACWRSHVQRRLYLQQRACIIKVTAVLHLHRVYLATLMASEHT